VVARRRTTFKNLCQLAVFSYVQARLSSKLNACDALHECMEDRSFFDGASELAVLKCRT
jgi:hypothetical protein